MNYSRNIKDYIARTGECRRHREDDPAASVCLLSHLFKLSHDPALYNRQTATVYTIPPFAVIVAHNCCCRCFFELVPIFILETARTLSAPLFFGLPLLLQLPSPRPPICRFIQV